MPIPRRSSTEISKRQSEINEKMDQITAEFDHVTTSEQKDALARRWGQLKRASKITGRLARLADIAESGEGNAYTSTLRVRLSASDAHYGGQLVNGAHMLALFGDVATELAILCDGDEGLLVSYESVEFLAPLYAGDFVEVFGRITRIGRTSRRMEFDAYKVIAARRDISPTAADLLEKPMLVGRAIGTTVVKAEQQRKTRTAS